MMVMMAGKGGDASVATTYLIFLLFCSVLSPPPLVVSWSSAVRFHANGSLLLAGGEDKYLRFFRIDGETNEKQLSAY